MNPFDAAWSLLKEERAPRRRLGSERAPVRRLGAARRLGANRPPARRLGRDWTDSEQTTLSELTNRHRERAQRINEEFPEPEGGFFNQFKPSWRKQNAAHQEARREGTERETSEMAQWLSNWKQNSSPENNLDINESTLYDEYQRLGLLQPQAQVPEEGYQ